jgi:hypothetical protein
MGKSKSRALTREAEHDTVHKPTTATKTGAARGAALKTGAARGAPGRSRSAPDRGKSTAARSAPKALRSAVQATDLVPEVTGSEEEYERYLPVAQALAEGDVLSYRLDPSLAYHNVAAGVEALIAMETRIREELPKVRFEEIKELPAVTIGLCFAASQVDGQGGVTLELRAPLRRAYELREVMLAAARALALAGLLPKAAVENIVKGRGGIDAAQDCVDLAALFRKHAAAVRGKTAVTAAMITEAATVGTLLLKGLRSKNVKRDYSPKGDRKVAIEARDRLATVVAKRHELARRIAYWLWGDEMDRHVPALQARVAAKRSNKGKKETSGDGKSAPSGDPKAG